MKIKLPNESKGQYNKNITLPQLLNIVDNEYLKLVKINKISEKKNTNIFFSLIEYMLSPNYLQRFAEFGNKKHTIKLIKQKVLSIYEKELLKLLQETCDNRADKENISDIQALAHINKYEFISDILEYDFPQEMKTGIKKAIKKFTDDRLKKYNISQEEFEKYLQSQNEVSKEMQKENLNEISKEVQKENQNEVSKDVQKENLNEASKEMQKENLNEASKEMQKENLNEASKEMQKENHNEASKEVQKENLNEASKEMQKENHNEASKEVQKEIQTEIPKESQQKNSSKSSKPKTFFEQVKGYTNNFSFLISENDLNWNKSHSIKFNDYESYLKYSIFQRKLNNFMTQKNKTELEVIKQILNNKIDKFDKIDADFKKILLARKKIIEEKNKAIQH